MSTGRWKLIGHDTFEGADYPLTEHDSEEDALRAARDRLCDLEVVQPSASSGGQADNGIQDRVFIERPDGSRYRVTERQPPLPFLLLLATRDPAHGRRKPDEDE
jgi:hypothetical protein